MAQQLSINLLRQLQPLAQKDPLSFFELLKGHLLAFSRQRLHQVLSADGGSVSPLRAAQDREGGGDVVLGDAVDGSVVDEQFQEGLELELADGFFVVIDVFAVPDFVLHVLDFFLGGVEAHAPHHVGDGAQRHLSVQLPGLGGMLVLGPDLTVVEKVLEVAHHLALRSAFQQVRERVALWLFIETLGQD